MTNLQSRPIKVIFLDRDGTILEDSGFPFKEKDLCFIPYSFRALNNMQSIGFRIVIVTNQSGVGRGFFTENDYYKFNSMMLEKLRTNGIKIDHVFQCFHSPEENCNCRKPRIGMVSEYLLENNIDLNHSFTIGDQKTDIDFGNNINTNTILINANLDNPYLSKSDKHHIAKNLYNASKIIESLYEVK